MFEKQARRPLVIAHRGASSVAPENTLDAFRVAIELHADGVELDVHLSSDGVPVVIHDRRLDRTTDRMGKVSSFSFQELGGFDAGVRFRRKLSTSPRLRARVTRTLGSITQPLTDGLRTVPTLESVLTLLKRSPVSRIYIELKGTRNTRSALLAETIRLVRSFRLEDRVRLISFDHELIARAREIGGDLRTGILVPGPVTRMRRWPSLVHAARRASTNEVALHYTIATRRTVERLKEQGLEVAAWTANNRIVMRRLLTAGVDAIMTNFVDRLQSEIETANGTECGSKLRRGRRGVRALGRRR